MTEVSGDLVIHRAVEEVFDFVADERNAYDQRQRAAELLSDGPIGVGSRFRTESASMGRRVEMFVEITEYERPHALGSVTRVSGMDIESTMRFEAVEEGTRLRWTSRIRPHGWWKLCTPVLGLMGRRQLATIWDGLRQTLETRARP